MNYGLPVKKANIPVRLLILAAILIVGTVVAILMFKTLFIPSLEETARHYQIGYGLLFYIPFVTIALLSVCLLPMIGALLIYLYIWQYQLIKNAKAVYGDLRSGVPDLLLIMFVPLYVFYWWFSRGESVRRAMLARTGSANSSGALALVLLIPVVGVVIAMAIMQSDFNQWDNAPVFGAPMYGAPVYGDPANGERGANGQ